MDLESLLKERKAKLKPCATVVTDTSGKRYEIEHGQRKELPEGLPYVADPNPDLQVACIMPGLYLSSQDPVVSIEILRRYKIKHILSIGIEPPVRFEGIEYYFCDLLDLPESNIVPSIERCVKIIHGSRSENVLTHCNAGVSRSPAIIIAYLIISENLSYDEAYEKVKSKRNCIKPNVGFVKQLKKLTPSEFPL